MICITFHKCLRFMSSIPSCSISEKKPYLLGLFDLGLKICCRMSYVSTSIQPVTEICINLLELSVADFPRSMHNLLEVSFSSKASKQEEHPTPKLQLNLRVTTTEEACRKKREEMVLLYHVE